MSLFIKKPKPPKNDEHLQSLFLMHAGGLKVKRLFCPQCRIFTLHFIEVRDGRRHKLCDLCGTEQTESA